MAEDTTQESMHDFRRLVLNISSHLTSEEVYKLGYIFILPEAQYKNKSALEVLVLLEMQGEFSASKPEALIAILKDLNRTDLVKMIEAYRKRVSHTRRQRTDRVHAVDRRTEGTYFEVAFMQNLIMTTQLQRLQGVVRESAARRKLEEAEKKITEAQALLSLVGNESVNLDEKTGKKNYHF